MIRFYNEYYVIAIKKELGFYENTEKVLNKHIRKSLYIFNVILYRNMLKFL